MKLFVALNEDPTKVDPAVLLTEWMGEPAENDVWASGEEAYEVHEQSIWEAAA